MCMGQGAGWAQAMSQGKICRAGMLLCSPVYSELGPLDSAASRVPWEQSISIPFLVDFTAAPI